MDLQQFNTSDIAYVREQLGFCCGAALWVERMAEQWPFASEQALAEQAEQIWYEVCDEADWREAFTHHPKIGDVESLGKKFAGTQHWAGNEQSGVQTAALEVLQSLADANHAYEARFGFIFIVCATGKSAPEMLRLLQDRLSNSQDEELAVAMGEQHKITLIRLQKLLPNADWGCLKPSRITTHVLDTAIGKPAKDLSIRLQRKNAQGHWATFCQGVTNQDGRIGDLLPPARALRPAAYKIVFETASYLQDNQMPVFYPIVEVQFQLSDERHHHIPLLLNPYGYSTYRGS